MPRSYWVNTVLTFVEASEDDGGKGERPDTVIDLFKCDGLVGQRRGDEERAAPGDVAVLIDASNLGVPRVLEGR